MRKQYSFVPSEHGYDAWDVDHLIELAADLPTREVSLEELSELDTPYWFGTHGDPMTVRIVVEHCRRIRDADDSYPIILGADGRVMDGMHRVAKALLEGRKTITAVQFPAQPPPDHRDVQPDELPY